ncbi:MAG: membrane protein insertase YidC [Rhabdochlamydiaceae bacterium]
MDKRSLFFVCALTCSFYFVNNYFADKGAEKRKQLAYQSKAVHQDTIGDHAHQKTSFVETQAQEEEQFYVLENEYQQLVFSNHGAALVEINLPFYSKTNPFSLVRPISIDEEIAHKQPNNNLFPLASIGQQKEGGYYPLLRRTLKNGKNHILFKPDNTHYALNIVSEEKEMQNLVYQMVRKEPSLIEFEAILPHRKITKTFMLPQNIKLKPYCFDLTIKVEGHAKGLSLTSGVPEVELVSDKPAPCIKYRSFKGQKSVVDLLDLPKNYLSMSSITPEWVANSNGFFGIILDPSKDDSRGFSVKKLEGAKFPSRLTLCGTDYNMHPADNYPGYQVFVHLPSQPQTTTFHIFAGPLASDVLEKVDASYLNEGDDNPDFKAVQSFHGWFSFISGPFAKILMFLMNIFHYVTHSWGFSIILLTIALRIMLYPLNGWSIKSASKMQELAPQVALIQEKHKKDPKKAQMEIMMLYKQKGVNPMTGCLPMLIQMPFLIGMFDLLKSSVELRGTPFIPGWINNLAEPDIIFSWGYPVLFFGSSLHLLPLLLAAVMYFQQKLSAVKTKKGVVLTEQQKQQKTMANLMTILFSVMFYHFPSGLNIYWLSSMLIGILQQWWMTKKVKNPDVEVLPPQKKKS